MWTVCITSIRHVLKLNGYGGPQAKVNGKSQCFKGWETLVTLKYEKKYPKSLVYSIIRPKFANT